MVPTELFHLRFIHLPHKLMRKLTYHKGFIENGSLHGLKNKIILK